ncbi:hypothetical protein VB780_25890 [Leptolyngbya sp. CCNP1308]|uniref:hypothetical protein n=1 Tax=Leptolyngbya sp. CCNP1308 TaxID=3110255 RepID=UPI002B20DABC|nr:hypothetical protein [Leptolyngbya sp. CCNP1308]MEA5452032.1 hypothetical protein [Leptolyngbya sp. CCNP1308]
MAQELMDRRKHPDYSSITAYLPKEKIRKLKAAAAMGDLTLSEAVEEALDSWMAGQSGQDSA